MSLSPQSHAEVHDHKGKVCPVTGNSHGFCPPQPGDSRSPCPALNTMANYGYISRDGKNLTAWQITRGLKACYGLTTPLAIFLSYVGFYMLRRLRPINLHDIGKHGAIEHDASLVHHDTPKGQTYAPIEIDQELVEKLMDDAKKGTKGGHGVEVDEDRIVIDATDIARARIRREKESMPLDAVHAEIARGEVAIILGVWETKLGDKAGVPVAWMRRWIGHERLPEGWKPTHKQGLWNTIQRAKSIRIAMKNMRDPKEKVS